MIDNLIVIAENNINDGQLDNLKALLGEIIDAVERNEPGTLNYEWFISDDGKTVHVYERYADAGACVAHLVNLGQTFAARLFACVTATKLAVYGSPNDQIREIFANFPTIYRGSFVRFAR